MSRFPFLFVEYADDVRQEVEGKTTIVGMYRGGMTVQGELPQQIPRLVSIANLMVPATLLVEKLEFHVVWNSRVLQKLVVPANLLQQAGDQIETGEDAKNFGFTFQAVAIMQPFEVKEPGKLQMVALLNGEKIPGNVLQVRSEDDPHELPAEVEVDAN